MNNKICFNISTNNIVTYFTNKSINNEKVLKIIPNYLNLLTFSSFNQNKICGVFMKLLVELSNKYGYRYLFY